MTFGIPEAYGLLPLDLELPVAEMAALLGVKEKNFAAWLTKRQVHVRRIMSMTLVCRQWINDANPPQSYATIPLPGRRSAESGEAEANE